MACLCTGRLISIWGMGLNGVIKKVRVSSSLIECAACLYDLANETTQLEQLINDLGHMMGKTPKCHPEIAGECGRAASLIGGSCASLARDDFTMELGEINTVM